MVLLEMGIELSERQIRRASEPDVDGRRKLPFFRDPVDGRLRIEKGSLVGIYRAAQQEADHNTRL